MTKRKKVTVAETEAVTVPDLTLIAYRFEDQPGTPPWLAESEEFKYLHPVNGREYTTSIQARGDTKEQATANAQAQLEAFMSDRGNAIFEVIPFTDDQLARAKA